MTHPPVAGFDELFGESRVMVILRGHTPDETVALAHLAWDAGVDLLEVTIGEPGQVAALAATVAAGRQRGKRVGAGTVVSASHVDQASATGAEFTVAPGFDARVLAASTAAGLPHLPGVGTATEVHLALSHGCTWLKAFPANALGPAWFRAIRGPFPHVNLVATGGITVESATDFLDAGARVTGLGAALSTPDAVRGLGELAALRFGS
ncbi:MAG TPA: bifunctional 4-hydroxy-2-oxoglutarate aldolase/2-dehydro-3-deoxy-phosphogluconate aldolase [Stackebrandtia sp.]|jgi:2-dehydro-3-deoxyphosphogluconate aldolase/(4S)-4-hydroxy-2-oxoglutarate aldolase|uniref:bifunctional 4-hydroxy-2-oxoglutarate aldolase/2-dehydro-3-deoxy-phosphogluconate aldolase n=1 Tax=Stackebrandtia sp. TaxID=2023065 RepID=UPI002D69B783|nr:bifunctional 4-hydroxy-2-oxoglutarate aldolase/2-dehydro-3-deoxy-phosphogluconate aldolase [Stackebrandtia sp.]HZE41550.1 bifunctional 4-hydroxy-2-oxoglutarate aldolase/2-dehydro-3-deoxy-phosphogluconate aldolase [Stackebrandtia sp.]